MHEFSLAEALLAEVGRVRQAINGGRLTSLFVEVGELAGVEADLFADAITMLLRESGDEGAKIEFERVPVQASCRGCGTTFQVQNFHFLCQHCGSSELTVIRGDGVILRTVTFEQREDA